MACPVWPARLHCGTLRNEIHPSTGRRSVEREDEISLRKNQRGNCPLWPVPCGPHDCTANQRGDCPQTNEGTVPYGRPLWPVPCEPTRGLSPITNEGTVPYKPTRGLSPMAWSPMACPVWAARLHCETLRNEIHPSPGRRSVEREDEISLRKKYVGTTNGESNKLADSPYLIVNIT